VQYKANRYREKLKHMQQRLELILISRSAGSNCAIFVFSYLVPLCLFCMKRSKFWGCKQPGFPSWVPEP